VLAGSCAAMRLTGAGGKAVVVKAGVSLRGTTRSSDTSPAATVGDEASERAKSESLPPFSFLREKKRDAVCVSRTLSVGAVGPTLLLHVADTGVKVSCAELRVRDPFVLTWSVLEETRG